MKTKILFPVILMTAIIFAISNPVNAHCDSYDGPLIKDALKALETNNVSLVLKWIEPADEKEITDLFNKTYALKTGDQEIYSIVEKHFLETLVRLHREGEGQPFTGLKPAGSASPIVVMADQALADHDIDELLGKLDNHINSVIREKYNKVEKLGKIKETDTQTGREFVAAYVDYAHTLEAIHSVIETGGAHGH